MLPDLNFFDKLADAAACQTLSQFRKKIPVNNKSNTGFDPVTKADKDAERAIRAIIEETYPNHGISGEEEGNIKTDREFVWVIDPIDGTRAFITGLPTWGTLIGLYRNGRAIMGMMDQPFTGERFIADTKQSYLKFRGGKMQTLSSSNCQSLDCAHMFTTSPDLMASNKANQYQALKREVKLTRYGCDCYAFAMVALGTADIVIETALQPYDIGGLISLVENAGGVVSSWTGERAEKGGDVIAVATPELHKKVVETLNR